MPNFFKQIGAGLGFNEPYRRPAPKMQKIPGLEENPLWSQFQTGAQRFEDRAAGITSDQVQRGIADYKARAEAFDPTQVSASALKAMEGVDKRAAESRDRAVAESQRGAKEAIASQGLYGRGAGGSRERAALQGQRQASIRQSEIDKQADISKTALESANLQSNEQYARQMMERLPTLAQQGLQSDIQATQPSLQSAQLWQTPMMQQQQIEAQNAQMANQAKIAEWQAQNAASAAQGQAFGNLLGSGVMAAGLALCDVNTKEVLGEMDNVLESIRSIDLYKYSYKQDTSAGVLPKGTRFGPMAQQVQEVIPEAVGQYNKDYLGIDKDQIIWTLFSAVKELDKKVQELEKNSQE